jgi:hypothetical protein
MTALFSRQPPPESNTAAGIEAFSHASRSLLPYQADCRQMWFANHSQILDLRPRPCQDSFIPPQIQEDGNIAAVVFPGSLGHNK